MELTASDDCIRSRSGAPGPAQGPGPCLGDDGANRMGADAGTIMSRVVS